MTTKESSLPHWEYYRLHWSIHHLVDDLAPRIPRPTDTEHVRGFADHGELEMAVDLLLCVLLVLRVPITPEEREKLLILVDQFRPVEGADSPYIHAGVEVVGALDQVGAPFAHRGSPVLTGGHLPTERRPGASWFPDGWDRARAAGAAARLIAERAEQCRLPNGRLSYAGTADGLRIGAITDEHHRVRAVFPRQVTGVHPDLNPHADRNHPTFTELLGLLIRSQIERALPPLVSVLDADVHRSADEMLFAGECSELADALAAAVLAVDGPLPADAVGYLRTMVVGFDLPVEGCSHLNDREAVLARLEAT